MAITKLKLSGSTDGRMVKVAATGSAGTTLHTAHSTNLDEVWLWAVNSSINPVKLTVEFGGTSSPDDLIEVTIAPEGGLQLLVPGLVVTGSVVIAAFAGTANVINIAGYVNRIS
mgnify:CR=1 FL=1